jgi:hypothetical protein
MRTHLAPAFVVRWMSLHAMRSVLWRLDVIPRYRRVGSFSDRQRWPRAPLWGAWSPVHRETRIVPPSPRSGHLLRDGLHEKMEERPEAPSVVSVSLPASAGPRGVSSTRTRCLFGTGQSRVACLPCDVPACGACTVSLGPGATQGFCGAAPRTSRPATCTALRGPSFGGDERTVPRVSGRIGLRRASSPACAPPCSGP